MKLRCEAAVLALCPSARWALSSVQRDEPAAARLARPAKEQDMLDCMCVVVPDERLLILGTTDEGWGGERGRKLSRS